MQTFISESEMAEWVYIHFFLNFSPFPAYVAWGERWAGSVPFQECFGAFGCEIASVAEEAGWRARDGWNHHFFGERMKQSWTILDILIIFYIHYLKGWDRTWPSYWQHLNIPLKWDHPAFDHEDSGRWFAGISVERVSCHCQSSNFV